MPNREPRSRSHARRMIPHIIINVYNYKCMRANRHIVQLSDPTGTRSSVAGRRPLNAKWPESRTLPHSAAQGRPVPPPHLSAPSPLNPGRLRPLHTPPGGSGGGGGSRYLAQETRHKERAREEWVAIKGGMRAFYALRSPRSVVY